MNNLPKRQRTDGDLYDAFMEISDIMTWNQLQPITEPNQLLHDADDRAEPIFAEESTREDDDNYSNSENETVDSVNIVHNNIDSETTNKKKSKRYGKKQKGADARKVDVIKDSFCSPRSPTLTCKYLYHFYHIIP